MSESSIIICATTESKSRKSKKGTIKSIIEIFQNSKFDFLYGPSSHPTRTPEKHEMALYQAIEARKVKSQVFLIIIVPDNQEYPHMTEIHAKASEAGVDVTITPKSTLEFIKQATFHRFQRQGWDMSPDAE